MSTTPQETLTQKKQKYQENIIKLKEKILNCDIDQSLNAKNNIFDLRNVTLHTEEYIKQKSYREYVYLRGLVFNFSVTFPDKTSGKIDFLSNLPENIKNLFDPRILNPQGTAPKSYKSNNFFILSAQKHQNDTHWMFEIVSLKAIIQKILESSPRILDLSLNNSFQELRSYIESKNILIIKFVWFTNISKNKTLGDVSVITNNYNSNIIEKINEKNSLETSLSLPEGSTFTLHLKSLTQKHEKEYGLSVTMEQQKAKEKELEAKHDLFQNLTFFLKRFLSAPHTVHKALVSPKNKEIDPDFQNKKTKIKELLDQITNDTSTSDSLSKIFQCVLLLQTSLALSHSKASIIPSKAQYAHDISREDLCAIISTSICSNTFASDVADEQDLLTKAIIEKSQEIIQRQRRNLIFFGHKAIDDYLTDTLEEPCFDKVPLMYMFVLLNNTHKDSIDTVNKYQEDLKAFFDTNEPYTNAINIINHLCVFYQCSTQGKFLKYNDYETLAKYIQVVRKYGYISAGVFDLLQKNAKKIGDQSSKIIVFFQEIYKSIVESNLTVLGVTCNNIRIQRTANITTCTFTINADDDETLEFTDLPKQDTSKLTAYLIKNIST